LRYQLIQPRNSALTAVQQILNNRGINPYEMDRFKYPTAEEVYEPEQIEHMFEGAQMLIRHVKQNDKIFI